MVMKSIFSISCFVVMALAIEAKDGGILPIKIIHLMEEMNATCNNLMNGTCQRVNEVVFNVNCKEGVYNDTFCQINRALLNCKDYKDNVSSGLSDFHAGNCAPKRSYISLKDFCPKMLFFLDRFYRMCVTV